MCLCKTKNSLILTKNDISCSKFKFVVDSITKYFTSRKPSINRSSRLLKLGLKYCTLNHHLEKFRELSQHFQVAFSVAKLEVLFITGNDNQWLGYWRECSLYPITGPNKSRTRIHKCYCAMSIEQGSVSVSHFTQLFQ